MYKRVLCVVHLSSANYSVRSVSQTFRAVVKISRNRAGNPTFATRCQTNLTSRDSVIFRFLEGNRRETLSESEFVPFRDLQPSSLAHSDEEGGSRTMNSLVLATFGQAELFCSFVFCDVSPSFSDNIPAVSILIYKRKKDRERKLVDR